MNRSECRELLIREGFPENCFDLNGGRNDETDTIGETSYGMWCFYYFERGIEGSRRDFATESEACEYLVATLRRDNALSPFKFHF